MASAQKQLLDERMRVCTQLWDAGIKVCRAHALSLSVMEPGHLGVLLESGSEMEPGRHGVLLESGSEFKLIFSENETEFVHWSCLYVMLVP